MLVLLDLSVAFDAINHQILIESLDILIGIKGAALNWFKLYLSNSTQFECVNNEEAQEVDLQPFSILLY